MLRNYLKIALRNLKRRKAYAFINIAGLAIGMACSILIFLSVRHDLAFDRFHAKADRIFRVLTIDRAFGVTAQHVGITLPALGPAMKQDLPGVEQEVRMQNGGRSLLSYEDKNLYAENLLYAENTLFDIFDFPLLVGSPKTALTEPNTIVLTQSMARRLFGDEKQAIGKAIRQDNNQDLRVTGIAADVPSNSHIQFDAIVAMLPAERDSGFKQYLSSWDNISMTTYVLLKDPKHEAGLLPKMEQLIRSHDVEKNFSVTLQPLKDIHLKSAGIVFDGVNQKKSDAGYVYGLSAVALIVLIIAAFNFMNLATARSAERAREVGIRKVVGAAQKQLIFQHLGESFVLCAIAFIIALALVGTFLGPINALLGKDLSLNLLADPMLILYLVGMAIVVAVLSGSYPAFVLSRFQTVHVLKGSFKSGTRGSTLRKVLVIAQFAAAVVMIVGSLVVARQLSFIMNRNMGYDREQVLVLALNNPSLQEKAKTLEEEIARDPAIRSVSRSGGVPGRTLGRVGVQPEGVSTDDNWIMSYLPVDDRFMQTLGIQMAAGRNFSRQFGTDTARVIINEAAARALGWQQPLGKHLNLGGGEQEVIGVVKDFHFASVRHQIEPLLFVYNPGNLPLLTVKIDAQDVKPALARMEQTWKRLYPSFPFEYSFLSDEFRQQYEEETNFAALAQGFTFLSILIACLGLFGLAAFSAEQRTKEIGVRKVMGASVGSLVLLLSREFAKLVLIAFVIATPIAYLVMHRWLEDFAYRIDISPGFFGLTGILALLIAIATVSYQALRAALADPVKSLRYE